MDTLVLQERDQQILGLLRDQGFVTFDQILRRFFPNKFACSRRLNSLLKNGYLKSTTIRDFFLKNNKKGFFPHLLALGVKGTTKLYYLDSGYRKIIPETNRLLKPDLCLHQLILNDVRFFIEDTLVNTRFLLSDPQVKILSGLQFGRRVEFTPDISVESAKYIIAVELERTAKSLNRYRARFWYYKDSVYTHVLYFYINEAHLKMLLKQAGTSRKFGFAHYLRPNQVLSKAWGYLELQEWIAKVESIQSKRYNS